MKKLVKMSCLAALAVVGLQNVATAGDKLAEALTNGKVKGQLKSYYFSKTYDNGTAKDASILVNGALLGYKTGDFEGLSLGMTTQFSSVTSDDDESSKYAGTMDASGAVMSEMYLQYDIKNSSMKAGRQFFWTPIVGGSGSRFIRQSFEGYSITNTDLPKTKLVAAYMNKFAERTDGAGEPGEFGKTKVGLDGAWTIYAKNNSINNLTLQGQYASVSESTKNSDNGHNILYFDATYKFDTELKPFIAAQYLLTSYDTSGLKDGKAYGLKAGLTLSGLSAYVAYTSVSDDNSVKQGVGSGSIPLYTNGATVDAWSATLSDTDAYKIGLAYKINDVSLSTAYSNFERTGQKDVDETNFTITYKVNKNLTAQVQYSILDNEYAAEADIATDLRTRLIYSF